MSATVANRKHWNGILPEDNVEGARPNSVYIGRPSKWGNPFEIGKDGTREEVIERYREWIALQLPLLKALPELRGKVLVCWCKPLACHGDVLAELANQVGESE